LGNLERAGADHQGFRLQNGTAPVAIGEPELVPRAMAEHLHALAMVDGGFGRVEASAQPRAAA
jgi:hypothetical protein